MADVGLIWAQTPDGVIGAGNAIPWRVPEDVAHFKATTLGHSVVMGRKTWESLPRPLAGRRNVVMTRDPLWSAEGAERAGSITEALDRPAWVIGGGEVYRVTLEHATMLVVTEVDAEVDGNVYAPVVDASWMVGEDTGWQYSKSGLRYRIRWYVQGT